MSGQVSGQKFGLLMGRIKWVDKWGFGYGFIIVFVIIFFGLFFILNGGRSLASRRNVVAVQDSESVDASLVPDGVRFTVITNVRVFSDSLVVTPVSRKNSLKTNMMPMMSKMNLRRFLLDDNTVLLLSGVTKSTVSDVESLLLKNFGHAWITIELGCSKS